MQISQPLVAGVQEDNIDLSKLCHEAFIKSIVADLKDGLPEYLYLKADFCGEQKDWIENKAFLKLSLNLMSQKDYVPE